MSEEDMDLMKLKVDATSSTDPEALRETIDKIAKYRERGEEILWLIVKTDTNPEIVNYARKAIDKIKNRSA